MIELLQKLDSKIIDEKDLDKQYELVKKAVDNFLAWKRFAVSEYKLLGFTYTDGDKIFARKALKEISEKLNKDKDFILDVYENFGIDENTPYPDAFIQLKDFAPKETTIPSIL